MRAILLLLLAAAGCKSDERYIVVTVEARPAVNDVAMLRVTLSNAGSMRAEEIPVGGASFPATFSISPEDRTGELGIAVEAFDEDGGLVGRGDTQSTIEAPEASVRLEPTDFVVNTEFADDQQLSNYFGANGFQLAAATDGTWTAVYNADCSTPCNVFGRRFDTSARPVTSVVAAGTVGFPISTRLTNFISTPAVANNGTVSLTVWNAFNNPGYSIECRALDPAGAAISGQVQIATDTFPDLVSVAALSTGNFAIAWDGEVAAAAIRTAIVRPDCSILGAVATASQTTTLTPERSHVAANGANVLYAWIHDGGVRVRAATAAGAFRNADTLIIPKTATEDIEFVRVAPLGAGFAVIARWAQITGTTGPGRLELHRTNDLGVPMGPPIRISDRSGTDFASRQSFGVARGADGGLLVVWHACMDKGDGSGCGVFGRRLGPDGTPAGDEIVLATTTTNDQTGPSAVGLPDGSFATAWTDRSGAAPDISGTAVRARILYPDAGAGAPR